MEIPVIDFSELNGENRSKMMGLLHEACEKWGFFQVQIIGVYLFEINLVLHLF